MDNICSDSYNINRPKGAPVLQIGEDIKNHFGTFACKQATYKCRIQNQYIQLRREALKINSMYRNTHEKFLRAIDHMEFHPTLGKPKEGPEVRLRRQVKGKNRLVKLSEQLKYITSEDIEMIREAVKWLDTHYMNRIKSPGRNKRFGLATSVLGWGVYKAYDSIRLIEDNIRALQEQNLLQQDQIIELSHYLNITYGHVSSNRHAITNLQIGMAQISKTLVATLSNVKFIKYTVAIVNDIRIELAKLTLGVMNLEQNVNVIYEYMRVLSARQVNPLVIPQTL